MNYLKYVAAVIILGGILLAGITYPEVKQISFSSPVNTTFGDSKLAGINMSPATSAATTASILNTDGSARWITGYDIACTGNVASNGQASMLVQAATTSAAGLGLAGNTNLAANIAVSTTSALFSQTASSTLASAVTTGTDLYYWPAGTYLSFLFNATSTGACTVTAKYIPS